MTTQQEYVGRKMVGGGSGDVERLRLLQTSTDGFTRQNISALGLPADARCLDLGAGAGGVAQWLGTQFADGTVLAVDIDTSALVSLPGNVRVEQHDIAAPSFSPGAGEFDLIHCRYVLSHLPERDEIVRRAAGWLRPGGWLMLTEPYHLDSDSAPNAVVGKVLQAYFDLAVLGDADLRWSRRMPFQLAGAGLVDVDFTARAGLLGGGQRDRWLPLLAPVADTLIERTGITRQELDEVFALLKREDFLDIPQVIMAAWGRRPLS